MQIAKWGNSLVAMAALAGCGKRYSEEMYHGQTINERLTIQAPLADNFPLPA